MGRGRSLGVRAWWEVLKSFGDIMGGYIILVKGDSLLSYAFSQLHAVSRAQAMVAPNHRLDSLKLS